ncbi:hypothetical protein GQ607_013419 [Colletotrichum asianum]|uniref:Uncharacterized protein n=1 Tax=Colletotrichum asianum TaxID=702518 RepID=A0A8H3ZGX4_9PEZI|nr:hypothetical protein GQ607_013419 [Colletotrichum asianum]
MWNAPPRRFRGAAVLQARPLVEAGRPFIIAQLLGVLYLLQMKLLQNTYIPPTQYTMRDISSTERIMTEQTPFTHLSPSLLISSLRGARTGACTALNCLVPY